MAVNEDDSVGTSVGATVGTNDEIFIETLDCFVPDRFIWLEDTLFVLFIFCIFCNGILTDKCNLSFDPCVSTSKCVIKMST